METKQIKSYRAALAINQEVGRIIFELVDGTLHYADKLSPQKVSAIINILQASPTVWLIRDLKSGAMIISNQTDTPGDEIKFWAQEFVSK